MNSGHQLTPVSIEWKDPLPPAQAADRLRQRPHMLLLESAMQHSELGRYSFLMADPVDWFQPDPEDLASTFHWLDGKLGGQNVASIDGLPPFQGGIAGLFGYEFSRAVEQVGRRCEAPPVALGVYDVVVAWDHQLNKAWVISSGYGQPPLDESTSWASDRGRRFLDWLSTTEAANPYVEQAASNNRNDRGLHACAVPEMPWLTSDFSRESYVDTIKRALKYIGDGDIFQVNLAQNLRCQATADSWSLYRKLRECNASTFAAYLDLGDSQVISASPERLLSVREGRVETRPIKGTRRRTRHPEVDLSVAQQLLASQKDRSENVMIVDLMRNDLSRICEDDSVQVTQLVELESYASVIHLVSAVAGQLRSDLPPSALLKSVFPGGSVTGAPKIRSMEIISELEPTARGAYCGSMGYFGFNGSVDLNILIRTITASAGYWEFPVGGGIVADSDPDQEYEETWTKAHGMLSAVTGLAPRLNGVVS